MSNQTLRDVILDPNKSRQDILEAVDSHFIEKIDASAAQYRKYLDDQLMYQRAHHEQWCAHAAKVEQYMEDQMKFTARIANALEKLASDTGVSRVTPFAP